MSRFIETIRVENGRPAMLEEHQKRMDATLNHLGATATILLQEVISPPGKAQNGVCKCRVVYSKGGLLSIEYTPYIIKSLKTFSLVDIGDYTYSFKFENRQWIRDLIKAAGTDEILMCKAGSITDSSYANLAFFNGEHWLTPQHPLLSGTRRAQMLKANLLKETPIHRDDLHGFTFFKCINAMMTWEESPIYKIGQIKGLE
jgi:4-amino-4-deoxychorismate lyase